MAAMLLVVVPACQATQADQTPVKSLAVTAEIQTPAVIPAPGAIPAPAAIPETLPAFQLPFETQTPVFTSESIPEAYRLAMTGLSWKKECPVPLEKLRLLKVGYIGFDGRSMQGELVVHQAVAEEMTAIFRELYTAGYPLRQLVLVDHYSADDTLSMDADNTSAFNYRPVAGSTNLSKHSYGIALDINPVENPYVKGSYVSPLAGKAFTDRTQVLPGMIIPGDPCHQAFTSRGWTWGGNWRTLKDYQHFEKPLKLEDLK